MQCSPQLIEPSSQSIRSALACTAELQLQLCRDSNTRFGTSSRLKALQLTGEVPELTFDTKSQASMQHLLQQQQQHDYGMQPIHVPQRNMQSLMAQVTTHCASGLGEFWTTFLKSALLSVHCWFPTK